METSAQNAQTLPHENAGPQISPQQAEQSHHTPWPRWQNPEEDKLDRRNIIQSISKLLVNKPLVARNSDNTQFRAKLPDFVRRLEEALYRTSHTKAEYTDLATLEARLQTLAQRMVSNSSRRLDSKRTTPSPPPHQNGDDSSDGPGQAGGNFPSGAAPEQHPNAGGLQGFSGSSSILPQDELMASSSSKPQDSMP